MTNSMLTKTAITIATVLTLGGAALANDIDESASAAQASREWNQYLNQKTPGHVNNGAVAYGFVQGDQGKAHKTRTR